MSGQHGLSPSTAPKTEREERHKFQTKIKIAGDFLKINLQY